MEKVDAFPAGLRVLVVDDDPTWLNNIGKMLWKCSYQVTSCGLARDALNLLRETKDGFDVVISDVNMPDMDGFKLLEHVGLEMDLPVIMMSVDGEASRVIKGVQHGACDYLLKPVRMKELRNIWQHVFRKSIHEDDPTSSTKRKDGENSSRVWSVDLHQKFVSAVNQIGFDKVGPKKILNLMNVPGLTRENVASHLQKYRLYLSRLQREINDQNFAPFYSSNDLLLHNVELESYESDDEEEIVSMPVLNNEHHIVSFPMAASSASTTVDGPWWSSSSLQTELSHPSVSSRSGINFDSTFLFGKSWNQKNDDEDELQNVGEEDFMDED